MLAPSHRLARPHPPRLACPLLLALYAQAADAHRISSPTPVTRAIIAVQSFLSSASWARLASHPGLAVSSSRLTIQTWLLPRTARENRPRYRKTPARLCSIPLHSLYSAPTAHILAAETSTHSVTRHPLQRRLPRHLTFRPNLPRHHPPVHVHTYQLERHRLPRLLRPCLDEPAR